MKQTLGFGDTRTWKHIARVPQQSSIQYLRGRDDDVGHAEVLLQPVPHELAAHVREVAQLQVGVLEGRQVVLGRARVQVPVHQPGPGQRHAAVAAAAARNAQACSVQQKRGGPIDC